MQLKKLFWELLPGLLKKNPTKTKPNKTQMSKIAHPVLGLETLQDA